MRMNFTDVIIKFKKGDRKAFQFIFQHYYKRIYLLCLKYFYSQEDAEEIVQDIFIKLWTKKDSIDVNLNIDAFIYTLAKNYILNDLKRKLTIKSQHQEYLQALDSSRNEVEEEVFFHELDELLDKAVKLLPEKRREIFVLSRKKGLTNKEIAEKLNISPKTVEAQMKLALDYFKKIFESRIPNRFLVLLLTMAISGF